MDCNNKRQGLFTIHINTWGEDHIVNSSKHNAISEFDNLRLILFHSM